MRHILIPLLILAALCAGPFVAAGQLMLPGIAPMAAESGVMAPTPAKTVLWTDKLGYETGEQMQVYLSIDDMGDAGLYTAFVYMQSIETGQRWYLDIREDSDALSTTVMDALGLPLDQSQPIPLSIAAMEKRKIWSGNVPAPGLWEVVGELRSPDKTQIVKRVHAKFVVTEKADVVLGADGKDTEIAEDTSWTNDTIYKIQHQVFVNAGATLTIEAGTLILARGQNAVIVVEKGGKIHAEGRREAPVVMTCDAPVGQRHSGCWAGLIVLGDAPMTRGTGLAEGVNPETRPVYGGSNPDDSSGVLRYVRVEFAGVDFNPETQPNAFGFHGVGSGTVIDHIQAHEGEDDGIEFFGGTANCTYCVSSGSKDDSLDWAFGWQGTAQYVFIHQDPDGDNGIEADNDSSGFDRTPRSHPKLYNVTMVGALVQDENAPSSGDGMRLRVGTQVTARNLLMTGFGGEALDVRDNSPDFFSNGSSSIKNSIIHANGGLEGLAQFKGGVEASIGFQDLAPDLVNVRYEGNPDPRPKAGSPALLIGAGAAPPSDGALDTSAACIGAFCNGVNWLEEWTFFGDEFDYDVE